MTNRIGVIVDSTVLAGIDPRDNFAVALNEELRGAVQPFKTIQDRDAWTTAYSSRRYKSIALVMSDSSNNDKLGFYKWTGIKEDGSDGGWQKIPLPNAAPLSPAQPSDEHDESQNVLFPFGPNGSYRNAAALNGGGHIETPSFSVVAGFGDLTWYDGATLNLNGFSNASYDPMQTISLEYNVDDWGGAQAWVYVMIPSHYAHLVFGFGDGTGVVQYWQHGHINQGGTDYSIFWSSETYDTAGAVPIDVYWLVAPTPDMARGTVIRDKHGVAHRGITDLQVKGLDLSVSGTKAIVTAEPANTAVDFLAYLGTNQYTLGTLADGTAQTECYLDFADIVMNTGHVIVESNSLGTVYNITNADFDNNPELTILVGICTHEHLKDAYDLRASIQMVTDGGTVITDDYGRAISINSDNAHPMLTGTVYFPLTLTARENKFMFKFVGNAFVPPLNNQRDGMGPGILISELNNTNSNSAALMQFDMDRAQRTMVIQRKYGTYFDLKWLRASYSDHADGSGEHILDIPAGATLTNPAEVISTDQDHTTDLTYPNPYYDNFDGFNIWAIGGTVHAVIALDGLKLTTTRPTAANADPDSYTRWIIGFTLTEEETKPLRGKQITFKAKASINDTTAENLNMAVVAYSGDQPLVQYETAYTLWSGDVTDDASAPWAVVGDKQNFASSTEQAITRTIPSDATRINFSVAPTREDATTNLDVDEFKIYVADGEDEILYYDIIIKPVTDAPKMAHKLAEVSPDNAGN